MAVAALKEEPSMEEILASIRKIISEQDAPATLAAAPSGEAYARAVEATDDVLELTTIVNDDGTLSEIGQADFLVDEKVHDTSFAMAVEQSLTAALTDFEPNAEPTLETSDQDTAPDAAAAFSDSPSASGAISMGAGFDEDTNSTVQSADPFTSSAAFDDNAVFDDSATFDDGANWDTPAPAPTAVQEARAPISNSLDDGVSRAAPAVGAAQSRPAPQTDDSDEDADMALLSPEAIAASVQSLAELQRAQERQQQGGAAALDAGLRVGNAPGSPTIEDLTRQMLKPLLQEWLNSNLPDIVERIVRDEVERLTKKV